MVRERENNGNWKGGICDIKNADAILDLDDSMKKSLIEKLMRNIEVDSKECWIWKKSTFSGRYGRITVGVKGMLAHKVSFILHKNITIGNLCVCHSCDVILCVNPDHLFLGTHKENSEDMVRKGRTQNQDGSLNPGTVLNEELVRQIKKRLSNGEKQNKLAREFNVSKQTINNIAHNKSWRHV